MFAVDEAEARGDALGAMRIMEEHLEGPDGQCFWKHWRLKRLMQVQLFGDLLPGWVTSRWILEQALFSMHEGRRSIWTEAERVALEARGMTADDGADDLDLRTSVMDQDWIFRQVALYDLGALDHFLRHQATPDLVAGADSIHDWARAPMGGYELVSSDPGRTTWRDVRTGAERTGPNIGSAALMDVGEHVIGRLVPIRDGHIFETQPVRVPSRVAHEVAQRPTEWVTLLSVAAAGPGDHPIRTHGMHHQCFDSDVPPVVWQLVISDFSEGDLPDPSHPDFEPALARAVLATARHALQHLRADRPPNAVDVWPCLAAALLTPYVISGFAQVAEPCDIGVLRDLAGVMAEPAASVCLSLVGEISRAA